MRAIFVVLSLLVVVAIVAVLTKKQLSSAPVKVAPVDSPLSLPVPQAGANPQQDSQHIQQQVRQSLESTLQQARPMPEDK